MEQILIIIGASIFGLLGLVHLIYTFFSDKFEARDASVTEAMKSSALNITRQTTVWNAWIGFNASHSLGAVLVAAVYIPLALFHFNIIQQSLWFALLPVIVALCYLVLAKKYWFNVPFTGMLISTICFSVSSFSLLVSN